MSEAISGEVVVTPSDQVNALDRLVGRWKVSGGATGTVTYEWMEGGFFLLNVSSLSSTVSRSPGSR
jgi:hypothetical protein